MTQAWLGITPLQFKNSLSASGYPKKIIKKFIPELLLAQQNDFPLLSLEDIQVLLQFAAVKQNQSGFLSQPKDLEEVYDKIAVSVLKFLSQRRGQDLERP